MGVGWSAGNEAMLSLGWWLPRVLDDQPWPEKSTPGLLFMGEEYIAGNGLWRMREITGVMELTPCVIHPGTTGTIREGGLAAGGLGMVDVVVILL